MIGESLAHLASELRRQAARLDRLPALPDGTGVEWAQNILAYPNGRLLLVDTMFPGEDASLVQVLVLDFARRVCLQHVVAGNQALTSSDRERLGISAEKAQAAVSLPHLWPLLREALYGRYVLAYDLPHLSLVLDAEAQRFHLEPVFLLGDDLLPWFLRFFQASGRSGLASLCGLIGHPLPAHPTLRERAFGLLALLEAMASGITGGCQMGLETPIDHAQPKMAARPSANGKDELP
jgi:hypothetical protein